MIKSGYLNKYRPYATSSLWANTWEVRYVVVKEEGLVYYKNERDVQYPPRGQVRLEGMYVDIEGLKRRKYWTFRVVDRMGVALMRLSTESHSEMMGWVEALERAGCVKRWGEEDASVQSTEGASPSTSGVSEQGDVGREVDSVRGVQQSGYTSDQSDVGQRVRAVSRTQRLAASKKMKGFGTGYDGCVPVHTHPKFSLLSSERIRVSNQSGLLTLMFIILAATNFRLILENMLKYGFRFNPLTFVRMAITPSGNIPLLLCWPALGLFAFLAYSIEHMAALMLSFEIQQAQANAKKDMDPDDIARKVKMRSMVVETFILVCNVLNTSVALLGPFYVINATQAEPLPGFALTMATTVLWLKLVSYAHVNWSLRHLKRIDPRRRWPGEALSGSEPLAVESEDMVYPQNVTLGNLAYFTVAPTLCYQLSYPRSPRFRFRWMLRRVLMLSLGLGMMLFILEQYIEPTIDNSIKPMQDMV